MKKMLVLVMVLCLASLASAQLKLTVGGVDVGDTISIAAPGDLALGVSTDATISDNFTFAIVTSLADGTVAVPGDGTEYIGALDGDKILAAMYPDAVTNGCILPAGEDGSFGFMMFDGSSVSASALFSSITLHVNQNLIAKLYMLNNDDFTVMGTSDTLAVNIIPEPITMTLLGIGGLFLKKRK